MKELLLFGPEPLHFLIKKNLCNPNTWLGVYTGATGCVAWEEPYRHGISEYFFGISFDTGISVLPTVSYNHKFSHQLTSRPVVLLPCQTGQQLTSY